MCRQFKSACTVVGFIGNGQRSAQMFTNDYMYYFLFANGKKRKTKLSEENFQSYFSKNYLDKKHGIGAT